MQDDNSCLGCRRPGFRAVRRGLCSGCVKRADRGLIEFPLPGRVTHRAVLIRGAVGYVPLSQGKFALIDAAEAEWVEQWLWSYSTRGYVQRSSRMADGSRTIAYLHRELGQRWGWDLDGLEVDHKNRLPLDCRQSNLRPATRTQNTVNRDTGPNATGFRGVYHNHQSWGAVIGQRINRRFLGNFETPELAARAYDQEALARWGEFAVVNFPL